MISKKNIFHGLSKAATILDKEKRCIHLKHSCHKSHQGTITQINLEVRTPMIIGFRKISAKFEEHTTTTGKLVLYRIQIASFDYLESHEAYFN
jgi:hypothetical protein